MRRPRPIGPGSLRFRAIASRTAGGHNQRRSLFRSSPMSRTLLIGLAVLVPTLPCSAADDDKWVTIKGRFVWDEAKGPAPKRTPIKADKDADLAAKDPDFNTEDWIIHPKSGGIKNVVVWLAPEP